SVGICPDAGDRRRASLGRHVARRRIRRLAGLLKSIAGYSTMLTQKQMFYAAQRANAERDKTFMDLVNCRENPMTREDLARNIERRPALWARYAGFLDKLPTRDNRT